MYVGTCRHVRPFFILLFAALLSLLAHPEVRAQSSGKTSCPLQYEHADPRQEDRSAVALRLEKGERLGSLGVGQVIDEQSLSTIWRRCIDGGLPDLREEAPGDAMSCIVPIALSFADELKKGDRLRSSADVGREALANFRTKWRAIDTKIATNPLAVCSIGQWSPSGTAQRDGLIVEVLNVMSMVGANPATQRAYLRAVNLDVHNEESIECGHGCARLYWLRRILEK